MELACSYLYGALYPRVTYVIFQVPSVGIPPAFASRIASFFVSKILSRVSFGQPKWERMLRYVGAIFIGFTGILVLTRQFNIV